MDRKISFEMGDSLEWVTNCNRSEADELKKRLLGCIIQGPPRATEQFSSAELSEFGTVGLWRAKEVMKWWGKFPD